MIFIQSLVILSMTLSKRWKRRLKISPLLLRALLPRCPRHSHWRLHLNACSRPHLRFWSRINMWWTLCQRKPRNFIVKMSDGGDERVWIIIQGKINTLLMENLIHKLISIHFLIFRISKIMWWARERREWVNPILNWVCCKLPSDVVRRFDEKLTPDRCHAVTVHAHFISANIIRNQSEREELSTSLENMHYSEGGWSTLNEWKMLSTHNER